MTSSHMTCQRHLDKIKPGPPKGAVWWNDDCSQLNLNLLDLRSSEKIAKQHLELSAAPYDKPKELGPTNNYSKLRRPNPISGTWLVSVKDDAHRYYLPLKILTESLHSDTHKKHHYSKTGFFLRKSNSVDIEQASINDPAPLPTRPWTPINTEEIREALKDTSNKSAPGPSGINYKILKWVNDACPEV
jgi:hypothetical protein